jgi:hypothetical protein
MRESMELTGRFPSYISDLKLHGRPFVGVSHRNRSKRQILFPSLLCIEC